MQMQGQRTLSVSQQAAWDALNDPATLKACIPGCDRLEPAGDQQFNIAMAVKIGPVSARFGGQISLRDVVAPNSYTLQFEGQGGTAGFGKGLSHVVLQAQGEGCLLSYTVEAQMGGKIAQLGQRLIDGAANRIAEDFFQRLDQHLSQAHAAAKTPESTDSAPIADASEKTGPPKLWWGAAVLAGLLAWWLLR